MRASDIITERKVKRTEFNQTLKDTSFRLGFECEMILDTDPPADKNIEHEPTPTMGVDSMDWSDIERYFDIGGRAGLRIESAFREYLDNKVLGYPFNRS